MTNEKYISMYTNKDLVCVECGTSVNSLFKIYNDGFIDVVQCSTCGNTVDPYVECEYSVILIDLILFKKRAYKHIIFNRSIRTATLLKFLLLFLLCDAYLRWFHVKNRQFESIQSKNHELFYELEWDFYYMLCYSMAVYLFYISVLLISLRLLIAKQDLRKILALLAKGVIVSSFGKLMVIPLVIWNPNDVYFNLAKFFTALSNAQAISVTTKLSNYTTVAIVGFCHIGVFFYENYL